jgi:hypothetical protein
MSLNKPIYHTETRFKQKSPVRTGSVHVGFVVDKVALGKGFFPILQFFTANIIPPWLHTHYHLGDKQ